MDVSPSLVMPFLFATLAGLFVGSWPLVVFLHELGHALMSRAVGASAVELYVGSYGDAAGSWRAALPGRITLWFRWGLGGMCRSEWPEGQAPGTARNVAILVAGPITSTIVAWTLLWPAFHYNVHGALKLVLVVFGCFSLFDLLVNLLPLRHRIQLSAGGFIYSDGYQLYRLLARSWFNIQSDEEKRMHLAARLYDAGDYATSAPLLHEVLRYCNNDFYRLTFSAYYNSQQFAAALALAGEYPALAVGMENHATIRAYLLCRTEQLEQAHSLYTQLLAEQAAERHPMLRNNRGYALLLLGQYEEALADFEAVIAQEPTNAYAHAQRGRLRLAQGEAAGLADLHCALELNPIEPFALCNLGLHAHTEGRYTEALAYLEQAEVLDPHLHRLADYLAATRACLGQLAVLFAAA